MAKCACNEPKVKIVKRVVKDLQIATTENGFRVLVGVLPVQDSDGCAVYRCRTITWATRVEQEVTKYEGPANGQEYVFADFVSLTKWLRENIRHGKTARA